GSEAPSAAPECLRRRRRPGSSREHSYEFHTRRPTRSLPHAATIRGMARILIFEPHGDIRSLLQIVITRLGHEPVVHDGIDEEPSVDAAVIEPGEGSGLDHGRV